MTDLYTYLRSNAVIATAKAVDGSCRNKWKFAASLWDKAMKHTTDTPFQIKLSEAYFMGQFDMWRKRHQHLFNN